MSVWSLRWHFTNKSVTGDALVQLYDDTVTAVLSEQIPVRHVSYRGRTASLLFDDKCRTAKRAQRLSERAAHRAGLLSDASSAATASYRSQRHLYVTLLCQKESAFWSNRIDAQQSQPRQLWRSFDKLLGRGKTPLTSDIDGRQPDTSSSDNSDAAVIDSKWCLGLTWDPQHVDAGWRPYQLRARFHIAAGRQWDAVGFQSTDCRLW